MSNETDKQPHPIQPAALDQDGVLRFKSNAIVTKLLADGPFNMNDIARWDVPDQDREQFAQLIGYSVSGAPGYVRTSTRKIAERGGGHDATRVALEREIRNRDEALGRMLGELWAAGVDVGAILERGVEGS